MTNSQPFKSVYEFCGQEDDLYWEILQELELSIQNLVKMIKTETTDLDSLKFVAHKLKSTFRILKDDDFKLLLDDYIEYVEKKDQQGKNKSAGLLAATCGSYHDLLKKELSNKS